MLSHPRVTAALALLVAAAVLLAATATAVGRVSLNARPLDALGIDDAHGCQKGPQPGALALESWLARHWIGGSWGIFNCRRVHGTTHWSLHAEGRALDWRLDAAIPRERAAADRLIAHLLASDARGRPFALARRMGVQEIIFNCRIWEADGHGMSRYRECVHRPHGRRRTPVRRTIEHLDHVHLGLNWDGAKKRTSFWRYGYDAS